MTTRTVGDWLVEWLKKAARQAAEEQRLKKLLSREEVDHSQKTERDRLRDKHWCYW